MTRRRSRHPATLATLLAAFLSIAACRNPPDGSTEATVANEPYAPRLSSLATPIVIPIDELRRFADRRLSGELYRDTRVIASGVRIDLAVHRRLEPLQMRFDGNAIETTVPLRVTGTPAFGPFRFPGVTGLQADLDVHLVTGVRLNPDWSVASSTASKADVERAEIRVRGNPIDVTRIVREIVENNADRIAEPVDDYLTELDIKAWIAPIWEGFASPIQLRQEPPVWLRVRPVRFRLSPRGAVDAIRFDLAMEMYMESIVGDRPEPIEVGPVPPLGEAPASAGTFSVAMPVIIPLEDAERIASERIAGREDRIRGIRVRLLGVRLSAGNDRLRAVVPFQASTGWRALDPVSGTITLEGRPVYDPATAMLTIPDLDYTLRSDSRLAGLVDWLLHRRLGEHIESMLAFPVDAVIGRVRDELASQLDNLSFDGYGTAKVEIEALSATPIRISGQAIELAVTANGTLNLVVNIVPDAEAARDSNP